MPGHPNVPPTDERSRHSHFAGVYTIIAVIAGTLAIPYHETPLSLRLIGGALLPSLTILALLLNCTLLARQGILWKALELRWLALGYALLAVAAALLLPAWRGLGLPPSSWLRSLLVIGFAACLVIYMVDPSWRTHQRARWYRRAAALFVALAFAVSIATGSDWPLGLLELLTLSGALMLLLGGVPRHSALEAWSAAVVATLILAHVTDPINSGEGTLPWIIHWTSILLANLALAYVSQRKT